MSPNQDNKEARWLQRLNRERDARKQAEALLEGKSLELYQVNATLAKSYEDLELRIAERTSELAQAMQLAQKATTAKSMFLASMSHEIRTPLNGVLGMTRLLMDSELSYDQRELAETLQYSAEALMVLLNDILDLSKFEAGQLELEHIEFDVRRMAEETCELLAEKAQVGGVELMLSIASDVPKALVGDPGRLRQVILNLLSNAAKFTKEGEIELWIRLNGDDGALTQEGEPSRLIQFGIRDTGIGIPKDALSKLFSTFTQVDSSTTRKYGGTGLGLSICKQLAEHMGGGVHVSSTDGEGSTFSFTAQLGYNSCPVPKRAPSPGTASRLLITSCSRLQTILTQDLYDIGFQVESIDSAPAVKARLMQEPAPRDILLDASFLERNPDLTEALVKVCANESTRLALLTSVGQTECPRILEASPTRLHKPIRLSRLASFLKREDTVGLRHDLQPKISDLGVTRRDGSRPLVLLVEDNRVNQIVAQGILTKLGVDLEIVDNGAKALHAIDSSRHDLVLMDCQMPIMDGYMATSTWRQREETSGEHMTIIAMTANAMPGDRGRCLEAGMDDYISKPFKTEDLAALLRSYCARDLRRLG
ncbi:MAG: signal transduction histidine kinase/ActR/RegA family two-component response regulator [Planctomycetota bacterium]